MESGDFMAILASDDRVSEDRVTCNCDRVIDCDLLRALHILLY